MTISITNEFYELMSKVNFNVYGILDAQNQIHTLGTDSKIIGRIFEMFTQPVLLKIAEKHNYILETPESQTLYPDFIMMKDKTSKDKIAIDVKTTYIDNDNSKIKFTLGSFGSYMRNNTKNIAYEYTDFSKHYVIGFIYKRNGSAQESYQYDYKFKDMVVFPYYDVEYFIQEKYKIAGDKPGSGNTENIGSFPTNNFAELKNGNGPFSILGQDICELYWRYYPKYRNKTQADIYKSLPQFLQWLPAHIEEVELLHPFDKASIMKRIKQYKSYNNL